MTTAFMQSHPGEVTVHPPQQFYAGDTWVIGATCSDADGNPIDLSTSNAIWRLNDTTGLNLMELTVGNGIALIENVSGDLIIGVCRIEVDFDRTADLGAGYYQDDFTVIDANGKVSTQFRGRIEVLAKLAGPVGRRP
jgi:hypothetical protein